MSFSETATLNDVGGGCESVDDFVLLDEPKNLALRTKQEYAQTGLRLECNTIQAGHSLLLSVHPPARPSKDIKHVACDIVLVIDVSGSMGNAAPMPEAHDEQEREPSDLTVLDLVRHACRTVISTLNEGDRLALVSFSQDAKVVQDLTNMTEQAKIDVVKKVEALKEDGATNLWAGIKAGLRQFETSSDVGNVQGLFVLTDGQPNCMCPSQGYVPKLKPILNNLSEKFGSTPTVQTFAFGYSIRSDLMLSIAKAGNGNYAFIPDVGMIGTVFVHAVANLYSTYAVDAVLELTSTQSIASALDHTSGLPIERPRPECFLIKLGSIQYGQSRDLVITNYRGRIVTPMQAKVKYNRQRKSMESDTITATFKGKTSLSQDTIDYHVLRDSLCDLFAALYPIDRMTEQHYTTPATGLEPVMSLYQAIVIQIASMPNHKKDPNLSALLFDLVGPGLNPAAPDQGQIFQALQTSQKKNYGHVVNSFWQQWGRHYLSSLWCAHMRQTCNTFKDAGPLRYGVDSDLFKQCRDELDAAFDNLPAPVGTFVPNPYDKYRVFPGTVITGTSTGSVRRSVPLNMSRYNRRDNVCFAGSSPVTLPNNTTVAIHNLVPGTAILNPLTNQPVKILNIIKSTSPHPSEICRLGSSLWITPWHPIINPATNSWSFPDSLAQARETLGPGEPVYSIQLESSSNPNDHAISVGGFTCITLGHGIITTPARDDVRAHPFFGDHDSIRRCAELLDADEMGRKLCGGTLKDWGTGLVCALVPADYDINDEEELGRKVGASEIMCG